MHERSAVDGDELVTVEPAAEPRQYLTRVDELAHSADEDDYLYTTYELRDVKGNAHDRFTVKIDGRA